MNIEKYTDRARGFIQSAQSLATREGHQQFTPEHVLKVLLDDPEGLAAGLIDRSGGDSRQALRGVEEALGGEINGGQVLCPGPGHSRKDRSMAVRPSGVRRSPRAASRASARMLSTWL